MGRHWDGPARRKEAQGQEGVEILGFCSLMGVWVDCGGNGWVVNLCIIFYFLYILHFFRLTIFFNRIDCHCGWESVFSAPPQKCSLQCNLVSSFHTPGMPKMKGRDSRDIFWHQETASCTRAVNMKPCAVRCTGWLLTLQRQSSCHAIFFGNAIIFLKNI